MPIDKTLSPMTVPKVGVRVVAIIAFNWRFSEEG